jgi:hypothetical protein
MKGGLSNKDDNYSLQINENYKKDLNCHVNDVVKKYSQLIVEYLSFIFENIKIKNLRFFRFIIIRGLDTITNVFHYILYFTKNIDLTYFHCQKAFYFFVEFVGQISEEEKTFLQLTTRHATTYVYKKTFFEITTEIKNLNKEISTEFREKISLIEKYIKLYQTYLLKIIQIENINISNIEYLIKIYGKLNKLTDKSKISILDNITEKLYYKISNDVVFLEISYLLVKKFVKNPEILKNVFDKLNSDDFDDKILDTPDKFIVWFTT